MRAKRRMMLMLVVAGITGACEKLPMTPETAAGSASAYQHAAYGPAERVLEEYLWNMDDHVYPLECPDGSFSDDVRIEGSVFERYMLIVDGSGGLHLRIHSMPVDLSGVSVHTGEYYRVREREQRSGTKLMNGLTGSYRQTLSMFGRDSHRSFSLVFSGHYREGPDGEIVVERNQLRVECR
jgi:hypothetical protein